MAMCHGMSFAGLKTMTRLCDMLVLVWVVQVHTSLALLYLPWLSPKGYPSAVSGICICITG